MQKPFCCGNNLLRKGWRKVLRKNLYQKEASKAQSSLELLLLVGGTLIIAAVVIFLATTIMGSGSNVVNSAWNKADSGGLFDVSICQGGEICSMTKDECCPAGCTSADDADCSGGSPAPLVSNPGFESGDLSNWPVLAGSTGITQVTTTLPKSGTYSARIYRALISGYAAINQSVSVSPNTTYTLSGFTRGNTSGGSGCQMDFVSGAFDSPGTALVSGSTPSWQPISETFTTPAGVTSGYIRLWLAPPVGGTSSGGSCFFDDITMNQP